ncbi:MAG: hypothetical protein WA821_01125, partial [Anaerolineales bacterium]
IISIIVTAQALACYGSNRTRITLMLRIHADFLRFYPRKSDQSAESAFYFLAAEKLQILR